MLMMRDRSDADVMPITQELLAGLLGVQRPSLTHAVAEFEEAGLILRGRRQITILDRQGLTKASCECYQLVRERVESFLPQSYVEAGAILPRRK
jgi:DNA-binding MarR family transcriptional regulator